MKRMRTYSLERQLTELARNVPFPITCSELTVVARYVNCSPATLRLLQRFNPDDVFENGIDFINRCDEVKLLIAEERRAPKELLLSRQD